jgi:proteasome lid subunit RPN8/RPN11
MLDTVNDYEPFLPFAVRNAIIAHMQEEAPKECCGSITLANGEYTYERHENVHPEPEKHFRFTKAVSTKINRTKSIVAFVHSHTNGNLSPSKYDMEMQAKVYKPSVIATSNPATGVVSVFSFGDHLLDYPLNGRMFHYGVFDCLEAVRAEAWQREGRYMPPAPRHEDWWLPDADVPDADRNMYEDNFRKYGYVEFTPNFSEADSEFHPQVGDVLLMQIASPHAVNHAAVYIGGNLIYQHRMLRLSGPTPLGYMIDTGVIRKWVRHTGEPA